MAHVTRRAGRPKPYLLRWIDPLTGKEESEAFVRSVDAKARRVEIEASQQRGDYINPKVLKRPFKELVEDYRKQRQGRPGTHARDDSAINRYVLPQFGATPIGRINRAQVQLWVDSLNERGLAPATVKREFSALQAVFSWALDQELIVRTPCRSIRFEEIERAHQRIFTPDEIEQLHGAMPERYQLAVLVGAYAGLRIGEIAGLHKDDIHWLEHRLYIKHGVSETNGHLTLGPPKTKHSVGRVDIPSFLVDELAAHIEKWPCENGFVFSSPEGTLLSPNNWRRRVWRPAVVASIGPPATPHDLRHTFCSLLIHEGVSAERVCEQARHANPSFTWKVYKTQFDARSKDMEQAMSALQGVRSEAKTKALTDQGRTKTGKTMAPIARIGEI